MTLKELLQPPKTRYKLAKAIGATYASVFSWYKIDKKTGVERKPMKVWHKGIKEYYKDDTLVI